MLHVLCIVIKISTMKDLQGPLQEEAAGSDPAPVL